MKFFKQAMAVSVAATMLGSSVLAAEAIRPTAPMAVGSRLGTPVASGARVGAKVDRSNDLFGAPLFLVFLGAVAITVGTIVVVDNNNDDPASAG